MLQNSIDGLGIGASYALLALGFTLVFGVLRRVNLAYGATVMIGLYGALWLHERFQLPVLAMAAAVVVIALLAGFYVERLCFAPHVGRAALVPMAATFAVWMQFEEAATLLVPRHAAAFPSPYEASEGVLDVFGVRAEQAVAVVATLALAAAVWILLYRTRFGLAARVTVDSERAAACIGVPVRRVGAATFALASALGAVAGYLIVLIHGQITPMFAMWATLKGMLAAMLGGLGSLAGAIAGGFALGVLEAHGQSLAGPQYRDLIGYALLFCVLCLYPAGLSGLWVRTTRDHAGKAL
ncbi:MAG: branched-chain amino acid ABC transporter permease [Betaproteobacteria bacterium]